jgi:beta-lactamase class A
VTEPRTDHPFEQDAAPGPLEGVAWCAAVLDADTGQTLWEHEPGLLLRTASVGKLFLLVEVARRVEAGELSLKERIERSDDLAVADSGLWHVLGTDALSIGDACALIGAVSDNLATNVLLERIGLDAVAATTLAIGVRRSALLDRVREERLPRHPPTLSHGTAGELAALLARLHAGTVVSPAVSRRVLDWVALNTDLSMVASAFGLDPLAHAEEDRGVRLWNKTGTIATARIDVGVVQFGGRGIAWAVLANWEVTDPGRVGADPRRAVLARMAEVGQWLRAELGAP